MYYPKNLPHPVQRRRGDIILDPLKAGDLSALQPIFSNRDIVKIFHGADYDIVSLKRDFDFQTCNLFDTLVAAQFLGLKGLGLADLIDRYFGQPLDEVSAPRLVHRPLLNDHLDYARGDTTGSSHSADPHPQPEAPRAHPHLEEECLILEKREWSASPSTPMDGRASSAPVASTTTASASRKLYLYRDAQARTLDRPHKVIGDRLLIQVACQAHLHRRHRPPLPQDARPEASPCKGLVAAVEEGLADELPLEAKPSQGEAAKGKARLVGRAAERVFLALKDWRNALVEDASSYNTFSVASNSVLKSIARNRPFDLDELAAISDVRAWQVQDHGEAILALLDEHAPAGSTEVDKGRSAASDGARAPDAELLKLRRCVR